MLEAVDDASDESMPRAGWWVRVSALALAGAVDESKGDAATTWVAIRASRSFVVSLAWSPSPPRRVQLRLVLLQSVTVDCPRWTLDSRAPPP